MTSQPSKPQSPRPKARLALHKAIAIAGSGLVSDHRRLRGFLADFNPDGRKENKILVAFAAEGLAQQIVDQFGTIDDDILMKQTSARFRDETGIEAALAKWAADSWVEAVRSLKTGVTPTSKPPAPQPKPPAPQPKPRGGRLVQTARAIGTILGWVLGIGCLMVALGLVVGNLQSDITALWSALALGGLAWLTTGIWVRRQRRQAGILGHSRLRSWVWGPFALASYGFQRASDTSIASQSAPIRIGRLLAGSSAALAAALFIVILPGDPVPDACNVFPTPSGARQWSGPPEQKLTTDRRYLAEVDTSLGVFAIELLQDEAPIATNTFAFLSCQGFYDNSRFHRVVKGFVIQGGGPAEDVAGGPGFTFPDEPVFHPYRKGTVAMANDGPNTNGSQFFILLGDKDLPPDYTILGNVVSGLDVVEEIGNVEVGPATPSGDSSAPIKPVTINRVRILQTDHSAASSSTPHDEAAATATVPPPTAPTKRAGASAPIPSDPSVRRATDTVTPTPTLARTPTPQALRLADLPTVARDRASSSFESGALHLNLKGSRTQQVWTVVEGIAPESPGLVAFRVDDHQGSGELLLVFAVPAAGERWVYAIDPERRQWSLLRGNLQNNAWLTWIKPRPLDGARMVGPFTPTLSVRDGRPTLLVNGIEQTTEVAADLPTISQPYLLGFGARVLPGEGPDQLFVEFGALVVQPD